jgi:translation initiation factor 4G
MTHRNFYVQKNKQPQQHQNHYNTKQQLQKTNVTKSPPPSPPNSALPPPHTHSNRTYSVAFLLKFQPSCLEVPRNSQIPPELAVERRQTAGGKKPTNTDSVESFHRNVVSLTNKLTNENFQSISEKIEMTITSALETLPDPGAFLGAVVEVIFEKAVREPRFADTYSQLCVSLAEIPPTKNGISFKKLLLHKCQQEFESPPQTLESSGCLDPEEIKNRLTDRNNGVPQCIGALFLRGLISEKIIHYCLRTLLTVNEADLLKFGSLMTLIGKTIDHPKARVLMDAYFAKIETMTKDKTISTRTRFKLSDVIDLRNNNWQSKRLQIPPIKSEVNKGLNVQEGR